MDNELQKLMNEIRQWSDTTFGKYRLATPMIYHLKKEVDELIEKLNIWYKGQYGGMETMFENQKKIRMEFADCMMLLLDSASHFGISAEMLLSDTREKLEINRTRKWGRSDENGVVEHIKEE
jgi:NTP pyrophosphatase (non-canonical NTP hydrolase)